MQSKIKNQKSKMNGGFTLMELLFVVVILGVLVGVCTPVFRKSYRSLSYQTAVDGVVNTLNYAREKAVMEQMKCQVKFDAQKAKYRIYQQNPEEPGLFLPVKESLSRSKKLPDGMELRTDDHAVIFSPDGSSTKAVWAFASESGEVYTVQVSPTLGKVSVVEK